MSSLPGYGEEDNAFYSRAIGNYSDHDPVRPRKAAIWAGPVNGITAAYTQEEVKEIEKQGRDRPRSLTHEQTELVNQNRREARADLAAMEQWYGAECKDNDQKRMLKRRYPTGTANYGHGPRKSDDQRLRGLELGDQFWQPVVY